MQTNKTIQSGEKLEQLAQDLIRAALEYWKQYQVDLGPSAVVWVEDTSGHFILFTRGEYKNAITAAATRECAREPVMFEPFKPPADKPTTGGGVVGVAPCCP